MTRRTGVFIFVSAIALAALIIPIERRSDGGFARAKFATSSASAVGGTRAAAPGSQNAVALTARTPATNASLNLASSRARAQAGRAGLAPGMPAAAAKGLPKPLPVTFEPNLGQADANTQYIARGAGYTLQLTRSGLTISAVAAARRGAKGELTRLRTQPSNHAAAQPLRIGVNFVNARMGAAEPLQPLTARVNYLTAKTTLRNLPTFAQVQYRNVYPGIDLRYYGSSAGLEHDWTVRPGGDPAQIRWRMAGCEALHVTGSGDLLCQSKGQKFVFSRPKAYQALGAQARPVAASYALAANDEVGMRLGSYDRRHAVVVDPVLSLLTFLGGTSQDQIQGVAVDSSGNIYVTGLTTSTNFPTQGPEQSSNKGGEDVFVSKLDPTGAKLLYSTYLGGSGDDQGTAIAVDGSGDAYVTGLTFSTDFPVTSGAYQATLSGADDAFVAELDATGSTLKFATYFGGSGNDQANAIAVTSSGNAAIAGTTLSADLPVTPGVFQSKLAGASNGFIAEIGATGGSLVFSTYLGGAAADQINGLTLDSSGNIYVVGSTTSSNFPVSALGFQPTYGGNADGFVTKLLPGATGIVYSSYLGGSDVDVANGIALDGTRAAYVTGYTKSKFNFPITSGAFQPNLGGGRDAFAAKVASDGQSLVYCTYLGGSLDDTGASIGVDSAGEATVVGYTYSPDFPVALGASQSTLAGDDDAFVTKLKASGGGELFSTFLGGTASDEAYAVALDSSGNLYVGGITSSSDLKTTAGALQPALASAPDGFIAKFTNSAVAALQPTSITFPTQAMKTTSSPVGIAVTSTGEIPLNIGTITITGDFAETDNCANTTLPTNASCTINVTFTPTAAGTRTGTLTINDNALNAPQTVPLTGSEGDFTMTLSPTSATIAGGSSTNSTVTVTPANDYAQTITFTCTGAPQGGTCSLSPTKLTMNGVDQQTVNVNVTSAAQTTQVLPFGRDPWLPGLGLLGLLGITSLLFMASFGRGRRRLVWIGAAVLLAAAVTTGCSRKFSPYTPAGTYNVNITGTDANNTSHSVIFSVVVD
jgi:hypothetical protein